jgi:hypothetical protein
MKNLVTAIVVVLASAFVSAAQDTPRFETFAGYTYVRANAAKDNPSFSANGGSGEFVVNFNRWVGFVTNIGAVHNGNISEYHLDNTYTHYMWGPRVSFRNDSRFTPFAQFLLGGVHAGASTQVTATIPPQASNPIYIPGQGEIVPGNQVTLRAVHSQTAFAMSLGGGFDIRISKHVSFRPIAMDWYMTRLQNIRDLTDNNQQNLRFSTGFNFTFGAQ